MTKLGGDGDRFSDHLGMNCDNLPCEGGQNSPDLSTNLQNVPITESHCSLSHSCSHDLRRMVTTCCEARDPSVSVMVVPLGHLGEDVRPQVLREADAQYLQGLKERGC